MRNFGFIDTNDKLYLVLKGLESMITTARNVDLMFEKCIFTHKLYHTALFTCLKQKDTMSDIDYTNYPSRSIFDLPLHHRIIDDRLSSDVC